MGYRLTVQDAIFDQLSPTEKGNFVFLKFRFPEYYKGTLVIPDRVNASILVSSSEATTKFSDFVPGQSYQLMLDVDQEPAKNGYPARIRFHEILAFKSQSQPSTTKAA